MKLLEGISGIIVILVITNKWLMVLTGFVLVRYVRPWQWLGWKSTPWTLIQHSTLGLYPEKWGRGCKNVSGEGFRINVCQGNTFWLKYGPPGFDSVKNPRLSHYPKFVKRDYFFHFNPRVFIYVKSRNKLINKLLWIYTHWFVGTSPSNYKSNSTI